MCVRLSPSPSGTHPCPSSGQGLHGLICQGPPLICRGDPRGQGSVLTLRKECVCMYERACVSVCECDTGRRHACAPHPYTKRHKTQATLSLLSSHYFICLCTQRALLTHSLQEPVPWGAGDPPPPHLPVGPFLMLFAPTFHGKPPQPPSTAPVSFTFSPGVRGGS